MLENIRRQLQSQKDVDYFVQNPVAGTTKGKVPGKEAEGKESPGGWMAERLNDQMVGSKENIHPDFEEFIFAQPSRPGLWVTSR